jgi:histidinol-phosphate phosphatase family protein
MLQTIDKLIRRQVLSGGGHIDGLYYCPHHPVHGHYPYRQNCECRKPHTGLINKATQENNLDLAHSFMIGDKTTDIETGKRSGLRTVMVETGYGAKEKIQLKDAPNHIAKDLRAAVDWVLSQ